MSSRMKRKLSLFIPRYSPSPLTVLSPRLQSASSSRPNRAPVPLPVALPASKGLTTITINGEETQIDVDDFDKLAELGRGVYSSIDLMYHQPSGLTLAVKRMRVMVQSELEWRRLTELDEAMRLKSSPFWVHYYGSVLFQDSMWICMEAMTTSLDTLNQTLNKAGVSIPETVLSRIASSVLLALDFLQRELRITRCEVEPSNILINKQGDVKMYDFGLSRHLVDFGVMMPLTKCRCYIAPERIDPSPEMKHISQDVRSVVWSIGITMFELSTGAFPFVGANLFEMLKQLCEDPAPRLPQGQCSRELELFIETCLQKDYQLRPTHTQLMEHAFISIHADATIDLEWLNHALTAAGTQLQEKLKPDVQEVSKSI